MSSYYMDNSYAEGGLDSNKLKEEFAAGRFEIINCNNKYTTGSFISEFIQKKLNKFYYNYNK